jgi:ATP-dependent Lhr-like helicase
MRRMELSGELYAGRFFEGINSLQFAGQNIENELSAAENEQGVYSTPGVYPAPGIYWMNAADPASPAGLDLEGLPFPLPSRLPGNRLCFRGMALAGVSTKNGRETRLLFPPEDPDTRQILAFLVPPAPSASSPGRKTVIETINNTSAARSPYAEALKTLGFLPDRDKLILW